MSAPDALDLALERLRGDFPDLYIALWFDLDRIADRLTVTRREDQSSITTHIMWGGDFQHDRWDIIAENRDELLRQLPELRSSLPRD